MCIMQQKTGVLQLIDSLNTGGAEVLSINIANALASSEDYVSYLCATRKEGVLKANINEAVRYLFLNRKKTFDVKAILHLKSFVKKNNITIIHAHSTSILLAFVVKLFFLKVKIIWHDHYGKSEYLAQRETQILKIISFFVSSIISVNSSLRDWAQKELYCKNVFFINNFPFFSSANKITFLNGIKGKRIIHIAAFREEKDHFNVIKSFHILLQKENYNGWTLHLIGGKNDKVYTQRVVDLIDSLNLKDVVFIYSACLDISHVLEQASVGVLSSNSEGLPIALLEYGLAKLPVVVTDVGECASIINNNNGYIVPPKNPFAFSEKLQILINSEEKRKKIGLALHEKVNQHYSQQNFITQLLKIYRGEFDKENYKQ